MTKLTTSREIRLAPRPKGIPTAANFTLVETTLPPLQGQHVLMRTCFMSVDPYMRGLTSWAGLTLVELQTPSLPDARPHSDRFRCGGRESNFLAVARLTDDDLPIVEGEDDEFVGRPQKKLPVGQIKGEPYVS